MSAENAWRIAREAAAEFCAGYIGGPAVPHYDERAKVADDMCEALSFAFRSLPMPPAFRAAVEAEVQRRAIADRAALPGYMPRYFGVWSSTGVHIGIWGDPVIARDVLTEYPSGIVREMVDVATFNSAVEAETEELRGMLAEVRAWLDPRRSREVAATCARIDALSRLEAKGESQ